MNSEQETPQQGQPPSEAVEPGGDGEPAVDRERRKLGGALAGLPILFFVVFVGVLLAIALVRAFWPSAPLRP